MTSQSIPFRSFVLSIAGLLLGASLLPRTAAAQEQEVAIAVDPDPALWTDPLTLRISGQYCGATGLTEPVVVGQDEIRVGITDICSIISPPLVTPFAFEASLGPLVPGSYRVVVFRDPGETELASADLVVHDDAHLEIELPELATDQQPVAITVRSLGCLFGEEATLTADGVIEILLDTICNFVRDPAPPLAVFTRTFEMGPLDAGRYPVRLRVLQDAALTPSGTATSLETAELVVHDGNGCVPSPTRLCLQGGRFAVDVEWTDFANRSGSGQAVPLRLDSGSFWFFHEDNLEVLVKVLDGCAVNGRYWTFIAGASTTQYVVHVSDMLAGITLSYFNALGQVPELVPDTSAFPTCP